MWKIAVRGIRSSFARFVLTLLSVALGVGFLASTLALKDGLSGQFKELLQSTVTDDLYVKGAKASSDNDSGAAAGPLSSQRSMIPDTLAEPMSHVAGVAAAKKTYTIQPQLRTADKTFLGQSSPAPKLVIGYTSGRNNPRLVSGRYPTGTKQIAMEQGAAQENGVHVGDRLTLIYQSDTYPVTVTGIVNYGSTMVGATICMMDNNAVKNIIRTYARDSLAAKVRQHVEKDPALAPLPPAVRQQAIDKAVDKAVDEYDKKPLEIGEIAIDVKKGYSQAQVKKNLEKRIDKVWKDYDLSQRPQVLTRQETIDENNESIDAVLGYINIFLLVFVGIALFVGSFIISNTFRMIVRAQQRQFAMLRAIGVSGLQVFGIVFFQGLLIGLIGSVLGLGISLLCNRGLATLMKSIGVPMDSLELSTQTIAISVAVGMGVTLLGALMPARKAAKTPPVEAMRAMTESNRKSYIVSSIAGGIITISGFAAMQMGAAMKTQQPGLLLGVGITLFIIGLLAATPALGAPLAWLCGWLFRPLRPIGTLAVRNVLRNPTRTAATASALTVGVALVTLGTVMAASMTKATDSIIDTQIKAQLIVVAQGSQSIPEGLDDTIAKMNGVTHVNSDFSVGTAKVAWAKKCGSSRCTSSSRNTVVTETIDPSSIGKDLTMEVASGSLASFQAHSNNVLVSKSFAKDNDIRAGDPISVQGEKTTRKAHVAAIVRSSVVSAPLIVSSSYADDIGMSVLATTAMLVRVAPDASVHSVQHRIDSVLADKYPGLAVFTKDQYKDSMATQVTSMLAVVYSLLALSILIAVLGIINTQSISVSERIQEIGLLRAVGISRTKISGMIVIESILTSIVGSVIGFAAGAAVSRYLFAYLINKDFGLETFVFPYSSIGMMVASALVIGIVAGIIPSIRAGRVRLLTAVARND